MLALRTAEGRTVAMQSKSWPLAPSQGISSRVYSRPGQTVNMLGGGQSDYPTLYWTQPWVQTVINKLIRSVARLELKTYEYDADRNAKEAPLSPPAKIFRAPYPRAGAFQLKEFIIGSLAVWGNCTLVKFRGGNGRTPAELWPMPFQRVTIVEGREQPIIAYMYAGLNTSGAIGTKPIIFLPEDVVHFSWFNPDGHPYGRSPLEALATTLALENAGQRYALASYGNAARPASFIVSDNKLNKEQREHLRAEIDAAYGGPDNAFKIALLDNGLDWKPIGGSMHDSGLTDNRKLSREEVAAVYDISPPLVGILDHGTYSNVSELHVQFYMTTIAPILTMLQDTLNAQFMSEDAWTNLFTKFDMGDVVYGDFDKRTAGYQRMFMSGMRTPNELRADNGDSPFGDPNDAKNPANMLYVPVNTAPVDAEGRLQPLKLPTPDNPNPRDPGLAAPVADDEPAAPRDSATADTTGAKDDDTAAGQTKKRRSTRKKPEVASGA